MEIGRRLTEAKEISRLSHSEWSIPDWFQPYYRRAAQSPTKNSIDAAVGLVARSTHSTVNSVRRWNLTKVGGAASDTCRETLRRYVRLYIHF
jgi:hypothetical protein